MYSQATVRLLVRQAVLSGDREGEKPKTGKQRGAQPVHGKVVGLDCANGAGPHPSGGRRQQVMDIKVIFPMTRRIRRVR